MEQVPKFSACLVQGALMKVLGPLLALTLASYTFFVSPAKSEGGNH